VLPRDRYDAVLFDMDGVVTDTASAHAAAWKRLFDVYLEERAERDATDFQPFDANADYRRHVDGMPRYDGVKRFLESRGIELPFGDPDDDADAETVCGLGNRKDGYFHEWLAAHGVRTFPGTLEFIGIGEDQPVGNLGITAFAAERDFEDPVTVKVRPSNRSAMRRRRTGQMRDHAIVAQ